MTPCGSSAGLGYLMLQANARMQVDVMFAALFVLAVFAVGLLLAVPVLAYLYPRLQALPSDPVALSESIQSLATDPTLLAIAFAVSVVSTTFLYAYKTAFYARVDPEVRDGHGDLRLEHVYCTAEGIRIIEHKEETAKARPRRSYRTPCERKRSASFGVPALRPRQLQGRPMFPPQNAGLAVRCTKPDRKRQPADLAEAGLLGEFAPQPVLAAAAEEHAALAAEGLLAHRRRFAAERVDHHQRPVPSRRHHDVVVLAGGAQAIAATSARASRAAARSDRCDAPGAPLSTSNSARS